MEIVLKRQHRLTDCIIGDLCLNGLPFFRTLELPYRMNQKDVSCIPEGRYLLHRHTSPSFGECFEVMNVPSRGDILVHPANWASELLGCIAIGSRFDTLTDKNAIVNSKSAFIRFMDKMKGIDKCPIEIVSRV